MENPIGRMKTNPTDDNNVYVYVYVFKRHLWRTGEGGEIGAPEDFHCVRVYRVTVQRIVFTVFYSFLRTSQLSRHEF